MPGPEYSAARAETRGAARGCARLPPHCSHARTCPSALDPIAQLAPKPSARPSHVDPAGLQGWFHPGCAGAICAAETLYRWVPTCCRRRETEETVADLLRAALFSTLLLRRALVVLAMLVRLEHVR